MLKDLISLVYPLNCVTCGNSLFRQEHSFCSRCRYRMPETGYHLFPDNPVMNLLRGRAELFSAASYLEFSKNSSVQRLVHAFKYWGKKEIGLELGRVYGLQLGASPLFNTAEVLIPVPLHPARLRRRGFNQSAVFAEGISRSTGFTVEEHYLSRAVSSSTQTTKSRYERWKNVASIFHAGNPAGIENKHVILVDDVVTTGSTLEACVWQLKKVPGIKISVATLAYAPL